jgi:hypothetical protein
MVGSFGVAAQLAGQQPSTLPAIVPQHYHPKLSDFRIAGSDVLPETQSAQNVVLSDTISVIPDHEGVDRIVAPPLAVVLRQKIGVRDVSTGQSYVNGAPQNGFVRIGDTQSIWEPGQWLVSMHGRILSLDVQQIALNKPQGIIEKIAVRNQSSVVRTVQLFSIQQPSITSPKLWAYSSTFAANIVTPMISAHDSGLTHANQSGAVALASRHAAIFGFASTDLALASILKGKPNSEGQDRGKEAASAALWTLTLAPGATTTVYVALTTATSARDAEADARELLIDPAKATSDARASMRQELEQWFERLPAFASPSPEVSRFYYHAAVQLLYDRWRLGKTFILDPWYPTSGRDSGAMNLYCWDVQYAATAFTLLDPQALRAILKVLPTAPLTEHYSVDPIRGEGLGPFYAFDSYAYTNSVDQYLAATGDYSLLRETAGGKSVLDWLITLAEQGEKSKDLDGNDLLDYGDDANLLELHKTGNGPGYDNEVPSPNGERVYVYRTVADLMEKTDPERYRDRIVHFRDMADRVTNALNKVLWLDKEGWYGTRQRDGSVVPIYTIQIFELLRFPGLVPPERAKRLAAYLNDSEFVAKWGIRSMSAKDRLFDYNDHDWGGPISYVGTGPELSADLFTAGLTKEGWMSLRKILWWPDHMAVYPQGVANDSYTFQFSEAAKFNGRISAGHSNEVVGSAGVETVLRGLFGLNLSRDGSIRVADNQLKGMAPSAIAVPFRGKIWTVTQSSFGLDLRSSDGFAASFFRNDGAMRVKIDGERIAIGLSSRVAHEGRLTVSTDDLMRRLGVTNTTKISFRMNGEAVRPRFREGRVVIQTQTVPDAQEQLEITRIE